MRTRFRISIGLAAASLALGLPWVLLAPQEPEGKADRAAAAGANAAALTSSYRTWAVDHEAQGGDRNVVFALGWSRGV